MTDRFRPDASTRAVTHPEARGKRADRIIVDDPHATMSTDQLDAARRSFLESKPLGRVGRNSIPRSHRAEGRNFVD